MIFSSGIPTNTAIRSNVSSNAASLGEAVAIWCSSHGYPKPICRIYHEGALVNINESVYVIRNFTVADQGEYTCNCSNAAAAEEVNITLYLHGELWRRTPLNNSVARIVHSACIRDKTLVNL